MSTPSTTAPTTTSKPAQKATYVVLARTRNVTTVSTNTITTGREQWDVVGNVEASSAEQAIRSLAQKEIDRPTTGNEARTSATLVAVPLRSWQPTTVSVETVSRVKLEQTPA